MGKMLRGAGLATEGALLSGPSQGFGVSWCGADEKNRGFAALDQWELQL